MTNLSNVKSVKTAFSMTKKSIPTESSSYLRDALKKDTASTNNESEIRNVILSISTDILTEFADIVKEIVISSRKAQESLEKLRRARAAGNASGSTNNTNASSSESTSSQQQKSREVTDRDKIVVQLYLDISELVNIMRRFGVNAESFQPFR